jgi:hypothetical protein
MRKVTLDELKQLALNSKGSLWSQAHGLGRDVNLYLHWSAGRYGQFFDDYHLMIDWDGSSYVSVDDLSVPLHHTYMRNTGAIGIAICAAYGATVDNLGAYAPTDAQIEALAQTVAVLCRAFDLTCDIQRVMTHAEAADNKDGYDPGYTESTGFPGNTYGPDSNCQRWDLWFLHNGDVQWSGGDVIRGKGNWYRQNGL